MQSQILKNRPRLRIRNAIGLVLLYVTWRAMDIVWTRIGIHAPWPEVALVGLMGAALMVLIVWLCFKQHLVYWYRMSRHW